MSESFKPERLTPPAVPYLIIADDLTGANGDGILLKRLGTPSVVSFFSTEIESDIEEALVYNTDSRNVPPAEAAARITEAVDRYVSTRTKFIGKRVDSTLRGNVGAEIDALLDNIQTLDIAILVAAYPQLDRTVRNGSMYVNNLPLHQTAAANDPVHPMDTPKIARIVAKQSRKKTALIPNRRTVSSDSLSGGLLETTRRGAKILIVDAETDEDIERVVEASLRSSLRFLAVSPGPFSALALNRVESGKKNRFKGPQANRVNLTVPAPRVLMLIGSITELTRSQFEVINQAKRIETLRVDVEEILNSADSTELAERYTQKLRGAESSLIALILSSVFQPVEFASYLSPDSLWPNAKTISNWLNKALAEIAIAVSRQIKPTGLYITGGDVSMALCRESSARGIEPIEEVIPLAVLGRIVGGKLDGITTITKGGLVGDKKAGLKCVKKLLGEAES